MNCIRKKLKNNSGASVLLALGLFIICTMISSVVIAAAAGGSSRNVKRVEQQKEYLSISSAAQAVMAEMQKLEKYVGKETTLEYACNKFQTETIEYMTEGGDIQTATGLVPQMTFYIKDQDTQQDVEVISVMLTDAKHENPAKSEKLRYPTLEQEKDVNFMASLLPTEEITKLDGILKTVVDDAVNKIYDTEGVMEITYEKTFTVGFENPGEETRISSVNGRFIMDKDYNITIELTMENSNHAITVSARANKRENVKKITDVSDPEYLSCSHDIRYKYLKGGKYVLGETDLSEEEDNIEIIGTKTIKTTVITWEDPKLIKGLMKAEEGDGADET